MAIKKTADRKYLAYSTPFWFIGDKLLTTVAEFSKQIQIKQLSFDLENLEKIKGFL